MNLNGIERRLSVLLVDDDRAFACIAKECLALQGGLCVETAFSSHEAISKMERIKPDVIVCSFQMFGEDPLAFLKELRDKGIATPFIGLIANDENDLGLKACRLGANGFVKKFEAPSIVYPELKRLMMHLTESSDVKQNLI